MKSNGCDRIVVMSLFPEYTLSTTQSIIDQVRASQIKVDFIDRFYQEKVYQEALAQKINSAWSIKILRFPI